MTLQTSKYKVITINSILSLILGIVSLIVVLIAMIGVAFAGFPPLWLSILLLLPTALFLDWFILRRIKQRPTLAFTYYFVTRSTLLVVITTYVYKGAGDYISPILLTLWAIFVLVSSYFLFTQNRSYIKLGIVGCFATGAIVASGVILASLSGLIDTHLSSKRIDEQTSYDFQLMNQDVRSDYTGSLPKGTAKSISENGQISKSGNVSLRADKYTYTLLPDQKSFKLCANFHTDTMGNYVSQYPGGSDNEHYHHSGYQCIHYSLVN